MGITMLIDFGVFLVLLALLVFLIFTKTMSILHRVYLALHLAFMHWAFLQFAAYTTPYLPYKFLFVQSSYVALSLTGLGSFVLTLYIMNKSSFFKTFTFKLLLLPCILAVVFILANPNELFLTLNQDVTSAKVFAYGKLFGLVIGQMFIYVIISLTMLTWSYIRSAHRSVTRKLSKFAINGLGLLMLFGIIDLFINIINISLFSSYFPILSIGMMCAAFYMTYQLNRINVLDIIDLAHRDVMNTMSVGILVLDRDSFIVEMNKHVQDIIPLQIGSYFDMKLIQDHIPDTDWSKIEKQFIIRKNDPYYKLEFEIYTKNPTESYLQVQSTPILNQRSKLMGYMFTMHEVTEIKQLAESTKRQNTLLQQRNSELIKTQEKLYEANKKLEKIAITDVLTECYNRRYLMQFLEYELPRNIANRVPFTIIIIDIDYFKLINDAYGHLNGDVVLVQTARKVNETIRKQDILARYGGEEFIIYLPQLSRAEAQQKAEDIKNEIENNRIWIEEVKDEISVTISVGVVTFENYDQFHITDSKVLLHEIMSLADTALYEAKYKGRNLIVNRSFAI
ncbi:sensor domain-containing diguanylate cyclase [Paenibacillus endoradicis]|uniref:sensor domain-containing diguanylate cyclase n=1 Tax=Paenibacillus endoradicis TaxID=2972487 RepID=UPI002158A844|nr:sensor domain-containing diguanylate cyclase [Paenibacillus endoradicis]MCR8657302.1 sensor domain-containing diguanylate cyclase [Paenibacillus endoradicis]